MAHVYHERVYRLPGQWQDSAEGLVPHHNPVIGGYDLSGEPIYVGRAIHEGDTIPGKVVSTHHVCYVSHGGMEHGKHTYQVLTNPQHSELAWVRATAGQLPSGVICGGRQADGTALYIGRAYHDGSMVVGKVHAEHGVCYVAFAGTEHAHSTYEVLVLRSANTQHY